MAHGGASNGSQWPRMGSGLLAANATFRPLP